MEKYTKKEVDFERCASHEDHCGICLHYRAPDSCQIVSGEIWPESWCKKYRRGHKAKTTLAELKA